VFFHDFTHSSVWIFFSFIWSAFCVGVSCKALQVFASAGEFSWIICALLAGMDYVLRREKEEDS
jgi:hypothetical protein